MMKERKYKNIILLIGLLLLCVCKAEAQDDTDKRWALTYTGGVVVKPVLTSNPSDKSTGRGGASVNISGELYLPKKWNLQAGYFRDEVSYGDVDRTMEGLQLGVKKYFINRDFIIQPYLSAATQINWGRHYEKEQYISEIYGREQYTRNPRLSFAPGAGFEFYLFSCVAFVAEYSFNMGIDSRTSLTMWPEGEKPFTMKDRGMFHNFQLGMKVTFPFSVSKSDGMNLLNIIISALETSFDRYLEDREYNRLN